MECEDATWHSRVPFGALTTCNCQEESDGGGDVICETTVVTRGAAIRRHTGEVVSGPTLFVLAAYSLIFAGVTTVLSTRANLNAVFGPIDDHEPLTWLNSDGRLGWRSFWTTAVDRTEIGQWPDSSRFRPVYYLSRVGQAVLFGDAPQTWYLSVMLAFLLTLAAGGMATGLLLDWAGRWTNPLVRRAMLIISASVGILLVVGLDAWSGIVTRLGPAELPGLLLSIWGLLGILLLVRTQSRWWWLLVLPSLTGAALSKETFVLAPAVALLTGAYLYFARGHRIVDALCGLGGLLSPILLIPVLAGSVGPTYVGEVSSDRVAAGVDFLLKVVPLYWLPGVVGLALAYLVWVVAYGRFQRWTSLYVLTLLLWTLLLQFVDVIIYGGEYFHPRYWAIFGLAKILQVLGALALSLGALRSSQGLMFWCSAVALVLALLMTGRLAESAFREIGQIRAEARANSVATQEFMADLDSLLAALARHEPSQLIIVVPTSAEYEPTVAILRGVERRSLRDIGFYLLPAMTATDSQSPLGGVIVEAAQNGFPSLNVRPWPEFDSNMNVVCVFINDEPHPIGPCRGYPWQEVRARGM